MNDISGIRLAKAASCKKSTQAITDYDLREHILYAPVVVLCLPQTLKYAGFDFCLGEVFGKFQFRSNPKAGTMR